MWEFCLSINAENIDVARFIYQTLKTQSVEFETVLTCYEQFDLFNILVACPIEEKGRLMGIIERCIVKVICNFYKDKFLSDHLRLPVHEKLSQTAFKKALINFDKETDFYIISKNLIFEKNLNLDSFYIFKLKALRDKWKELVILANDNSDYLVGDDAFFDLLKFLIDNLEIGEDEVNVFERDNGYCLQIQPHDFSSEKLSKEGLISSIIELCPKKINFYCDSDDSTANFLTKIFEERVNVNYNKSMEKVNFLK